LNLCKLSRYCSCSVCAIWSLH